MEYKENFYWYYNKSLTRAFLRLLEKLKKSGSVIEYVESYEEKKESLISFIDFDFIDFYLQKINFTKIERQVIKHKVRGKLEIELFLKMHKLTKTKHREILEGIKIKLLHLYDE